MNFKNQLKTILTILLFFVFNLLFAQDLATVRERLTEAGAYRSIIRLEDKSWSYERFSRKINANGAFLRNNPRPTTADIKKDLLQEVFFFLRNQSSDIDFKTLKEFKDRLYKTLVWWLVDKPQFKWTDSALEQPRYVATILLLLHNTMETDQADSDHSARIKRIREEAADYLRYTWNFGKAEDRFLNLGDDLDEDVQRMGNVGYRLYAMTAIAAALDREDLMDSVAQIAENQLRFYINTGTSHPVALMPDFALHQHNYGGGQLYNLGYGLDWFNDFVTYAYYVSDSKWALTKDQLGILVSFLEQGIYPFFIENGQLVQQALGRHNQVKSSWIKFPESRSKLLKTLISGNPEEQAVIDRILSDLEFKKSTGFHSFYSSDFLIADLPYYVASIRLVSDRTSGQESGDQDQRNGLQNFFSSDGSFIHYLPDLERNKGAWDWRKVPGTTTALIDYPLPLVPYGKNYSGFSSYAGVMHTEEGALIAGNLRRKSEGYKLEIIKSYLLLEQAALFWGFGLKYQGNEEVHTTITQESLGEDAFYLVGDKNTHINLGLEEIKNPEGPMGIWNKGTGYIIFPTGESNFHLSLSAKSTPTKWEQLDERNKAQNDEIPLLTISIKHKHAKAKNISSDSYFYLMVPAVDKEAFTRLFNMGAINFTDLDIQDLNYSRSSFSLVYENCAWFVNFKKAATSEFDLGDFDFSVSGLIGGSIEWNGGYFQIHLAQMEKSRSVGQDFSITINNFELEKVPQVDKLSQPLTYKSTQEGIQLTGNTFTKNPMDFGSTIRFKIPINSPHNF